MSKRFVIIIIGIALALIGYQVFFTRDYKVIRNTQLLENLNDNEPIILGNPNAPRSITVFYDYKCSHCRTFFKNYYPGIAQNYVNAGNLNFILKPLSLNNLPKDIEAYQLLSCLNKVGLFTELHEVLLLDADFPYSTAYTSFTNEVLNNNLEINQCLSIPDSIKQSTTNKKQLKALGFSSIPLFILDNKAYKGNISQEILRNFCEN